jgi:hypothetical protein
MGSLESFLHSKFFISMFFLEFVKINPILLIPTTTLTQPQPIGDCLVDVAPVALHV